MSFGLEKCGRMVVKKGKVLMTNGVDLPSGHIVEYRLVKSTLVSYGHMVTTIRRRRRL